MPYRQVGEPRKGGIIACADHASNFVPDDIELGVPDEAMEQHIAIDLGVEGVVERLARFHDIPAHIAAISRLVVDLHRDEDDPAVMPMSSDGITIPGNIGGNLESRLERFHYPYHQALDSWIEAAQPSLILAVHSFTPALHSTGEQRPWEVGLLYNNDDRAAQHAIRLFREKGLTVGDNEPYSGKQLNATMDRHAESRGIPYLTIEIRQDEIATRAQQSRWADLIADVASLTQLSLKSP
ncbi:N-formylglutamate amidohydrolase [Qipengyuania atrilutea]|nr:N-formylglutamate amidohydrolase [Actirhodobacter atriluteus]